jgi:hypothetical protein
MELNVLEIQVQFTSIPIGLICFDPFSETCESYSKYCALSSLDCPIGYQLPTCIADSVVLDLFLSKEYMVGWKESCD